MKVVEKIAPTVGVLALIAGVWLTGYQGRVLTVKDGLSNCHASKITAEFAGDTFAAQARGDGIISRDPSQSMLSRMARAQQASSERKARDRYRSRSRRDCEGEFPPARWQPF